MKFNIKSSIFFILTLLGCSSGFLKYEKAKEIFKNDDFEKKVQIKEVPSAEAPTGAPSAAVQSNESTTSILKSNQTEASAKSVVPQKKEVIKIVGKKNKTNKALVENKVLEDKQPKLREPSLEDQVGFKDGERRPVVDPFRVGERVVHAVSYFAAQAGTLVFSVGPYVEVNGQKSYSFKTEIKSGRLFSNFYSVDDQVETFVDYLSFVPHVFKLQIKETAQLKEAQSYFDHEKLKANYWEKKYTEKNGYEEKKMEWELLPFSQNAFSAIFYMRIFNWEVGHEYAFRVSDDEKNIIFRAKAIERVQLNTDAGKFDAIKAKAEVVSRGALSQTGDLYFWISNDEHKYVLRIEAKIKIGTLVSEVIEITPGK